MVFNTGAALLDAIVLAVVSKEEEGTYGYKITQLPGCDKIYLSYPRPIPLNPEPRDFKICSSSN